MSALVTVTPATIAARMGRTPLTTHRQEVSRTVRDMPSSAPPASGSQTSSITRPSSPPHHFPASQSSGGSAAIAWPMPIIAHASRTVLAAAMLRLPGSMRKG